MKEQLDWSLVSVLKGGVKEPCTRSLSLFISLGTLQISKTAVYLTTNEPACGVCLEKNSSSIFFQLGFGRREGAT
jgi:hypothetical protein